VNFAGCHGVSLSPTPAADAYGHGSSDPAGFLAIDGVCPAAVPPGAALLWTAEVDGHDATHAMWRDPDLGLILTIAGRVVLRVDLDRRVAGVGDVSPAVGLQLISTFAIPLAAQRWGAFVLHAACFARDDEALVVCAESGTGKSSLVVALADAGWQPLSEDMVALDTRVPGTVSAWPGPPWVRVTPGEPGPAGAPISFETADKAAFRLEVVDRPVRVRELVLLDRPHDEPTVWQSVSRAEVIGALSHHAPWFEEPARRGEELFRRAVQLAGMVPARRLTLRRSADWRAEAVATFTS
jgi:hypothetical protein